MGAWTACDESHFEEEIVPLLTGEWSERFVLMDLRFHELRALRDKDPVPLPGRRVLSKRWGWNDSAVRRLLANEPAWRRFTDPLPRVPWDRSDHRPATARPQPDHSANGPTPVLAMIQPQASPVDATADPYARSTHEELGEGEELVLVSTAPLVVVEHDDTPSGLDAKLALRRPSNLVPKLWAALMTLYVGSGHGKAPLDLDGDRPKTLEKCLAKLHHDPLEAARRMLHLFEFWLYGPNDFWRTHRRNSALVATLLRSTEINTRYTEAQGWTWDGTNRSEMPEPGATAKQSNFKRQMDELRKEWEAEGDGDETGHRPSGGAAPSLGLFQSAPRG